MLKNNFDEASNQAWPSFVDILSSTIVVLCFALLIVVIVLSVSKVTSANKQESNESAPSSLKIQSDVLSEYRAEFQKLSIIANPSLRKEMEIQSDEPTTDDASKIPYVPVDATPVVNEQEVAEPGESEKQVLGDIPKTVDTSSVEVLKELIIVQRDVISQQKRVIEQKDQEVVQTVKEYQSLLSLVTKERVVEDVRQEIVQKNDEARFIDTDINDNLLSGPSSESAGQSRLALNPSVISSGALDIVDNSLGISFNFKDNAPFLTQENYIQAKDVIMKNLDTLKSQGVTIESKVSDYALSGAEGQRIAVERMLLFRSLLIESGIPATSIKLRTIKATDVNLLEGNWEENYGWINIAKAN